MSTPDLVESPFGPLRSFDGVPTRESVDTIYDAVDLIRGIEAFLTAVRGASLCLCVAVFARWVSRRRRRLGIRIRTRTGVVWR